MASNLAGQKKNICHLIFLDFGTIGSCVEDFVMFEFRQSLQTEYHDWEEDNEDRDDGHYPGVLTGLWILEQQPNPSLQIIGGEGFLLFLDESFIFPKIILEK